MLMQMKVPYHEVLVVELNAARGKGLVVVVADGDPHGGSGGGPGAQFNRRQWQFEFHENSRHLLALTERAIL